jgi:UDP-glucuronate decarboxylase
MAPTKPAIVSIDKHGQEMATVGFTRFGFDSEVPLDLLRSLYLRPHYVTTAPALQNVPQNPLSPVEPDAEADAEHERFIAGPLAAYQSKSIYHPDTGSISYTTLSRFPPVRLLAPTARKRILVTGGAGFVGGHLVDRLMLLGHEVTVIDNFFTGSKTTVSHWVGHPNFEMVRHDVVEPFMIECDRACSPSIDRAREPDPAQRSTTSRARPRPRTTSTTRSRQSRRLSWARSTCSGSPSAPRRAS